MTTKSSIKGIKNREKDKISEYGKDKPKMHYKKNENKKEWQNYPL